MPDGPEDATDHPIPLKQVAVICTRGRNDDVLLFVVIISGQAMDPKTACGPRTDSNVLALGVTSVCLPMAS